MTEDEMIGWHHRLNGREFEQTPGDGEGQGNLVCCSPWGHKESDTTQQLNNNIKSGPKPCTQKDLFNQKYLNEMFQVGSIQFKKQILNLENPNKISAH